MKVLNFSLVAHVDHGKSTLSTKLVECFRSIQILNEQFLDDLEVEKERGITVRAQAVNLVKNDEMIINLIDTPGHVDFQSEVTKSIRVSNLILLLVSAKDGVQSQTLKYWNEAQKFKKKVTLIINKIDTLSDSDLQDSLKNIKSFFPEDIETFLCSAKTQEGLSQIEDYLKESGEIIRSLDTLEALVIASFREFSSGYHYLIQNLGRKIKRNDTFLSVNSKGKKVNLKVRDIYINAPYREKLEDIETLGIAYIITDSREPIRTSTRISDKIIGEQNVLNVESYHQGIIIPEAEGEFDTLNLNLLELASNDINLLVEQIHNPIFGHAFICKCSGKLHLDTVIDRLKEMGVTCVCLISLPEYKITWKRPELIQQGYKFTRQDIQKAEEEWSQIEITCAAHQWSNLRNFSLWDYLKNVKIDWRNESVIILAELPTWFILSNFTELLNKTKGYVHYRTISIFFVSIEPVVIDFYSNDQSMNFQIILKKEEDSQKAREILKEISRGIKRGQTLINLQAKIGQKTIASEKIMPFRKDVTAKLYGGDQTRKMKLLSKQKKGKARLKKETIINFDRKLFIKKKKKEA